MLELMDLLRDWLDGDILCQIEDVHADYDNDEYILFNGTVRDAFYQFRDLENEGTSYELYQPMEIDPSNGLLYIMVEER